MPVKTMTFDTTKVKPTDGTPIGVAYVSGQAHTISKVYVIKQSNSGMKINMTLNQLRSGIFGDSLTYALLIDKPMTFGSPSSGGAVSEWKSWVNPTQTAATQSTTADQPSYHGSGYMVFSSGTPGDHLSLPSAPFAFAASEEFTIFTAIVLLTQNSDNDAFILGGTTSTETSPRSVYGVMASRRTVCDQDGNKFQSNSNVPTSSEIRSISRHSDNELYEYVNGTQTINGDNSCSDPLNFTFINNASHRGGEEGGGSLRLMEVLVYNESTQTMSTATRQQIEGYLAHKYSLTSGLPTGHPYKTTDPRDADGDYTVKQFSSDMTTTKTGYDESNPPSLSAPDSDFDIETFSPGISVSADQVVQFVVEDMDEPGKAYIKVEYTVD